MKKIGGRTPREKKNEVKEKYWASYIIKKKMQFLSKMSLKFKGCLNLIKRRLLNLFSIFKIY